jgi:hypothetical protein
MEGRLQGEARCADVDAGAVAKAVQAAAALGSSM